jgi:hypothetical protein
MSQPYPGRYECTEVCPIARVQVCLPCTVVDFQAGLSSVMYQKTAKVLDCTLPRRREISFVLGVLAYSL